MGGPVPRGGRGRISTLEIECAEQGLDWREIRFQQAEEESLRRELGLPSKSLSSTPGRNVDASSQLDEEDAGA
jgi:capsid protein